MGSRQGWLGLALVAFLVIGLVSLVWGRLLNVAPGLPQHIILQGSYQLADSVDDALVVISDRVTIDAAGDVAGSAALIGFDGVSMAGRLQDSLTAAGDDVTVSGPVTGDVTLIGNRLEVTGTLSGELVAIGQTLTLGPQAQIAGGVVACVGEVDDRRLGAPADIRPCSQNLALSPLAFSGGAAPVLPTAAVLGALLLVGLAALTVTLFPRQFGRAGDAVRLRPRSLTLNGLAALLLAAGLASGVLIATAALPVLGIVLLPAALLLALALLILLAAGWLTLALVVGDWLLRQLGRAPQPPLLAAALGMAALAAAGYVLALIPFGVVALLAGLALLGVLGMGAMLATRLGTRSLRSHYLVQG